jgi:hypothetical protein
MNMGVTLGISAKERTFRSKVLRRDLGPRKRNYKGSRENSAIRSFIIFVQVLSDT